MLTNATMHQNDPRKSDHFAGEMLAQLLVEHDRLGELRQRADDGDSYAATALAKYLDAGGMLDELRGRAEAGDSVAANHLARRQAKDDVDAAILGLRVGIDAGQPGSVVDLARLLVDHHRVDEAIALLREHISSGNSFVEAALIEILTKHGRLVELREERTAGTHDAALALRSLERGEPWPRRPQQPGESDAKPPLRLYFQFLNPL